MPAGRPTKYTDELQAKADTYLDAYEAEGDAIPSAIGLADYLGISRATLYSWGDDEDKPRFLDILDKVQRKQFRLLVSNGLNNTFNANIAKLVLGKHGYSDKSENTNTNTHTIESFLDHCE